MRVGRFWGGCDLERATGFVWFYGLCVVMALSTAEVMLIFQLLATRPVTADRRTDMTEVIVVFDILRTRLNMIKALILIHKILNAFVNFVFNIDVA